MNQDRITSIFNTLKSNDIDNYDDDSLTDMISILTYEELDSFITKSYVELGVLAFLRICDLRHLIEYKIKREIYFIETSDMYVDFLKSLQANEYRSYIETLSLNDLAKLRRILNAKQNYKNNVAINKLLDIISDTVIKKDVEKTKNISA